jgi:hypothetical protein
MKFYVTKEGKNLGPFDLEEVNKKLSHKEFLPEDMAWMEGMEKWTPINDKRFISKGILIEKQSGPPPPLPSILPSDHKMNKRESNPTIQDVGEVTKKFAQSLFKKTTEVVNRVVTQTSEDWKKGALDVKQKREKKLLEKKLNNEEQIEIKNLDAKSGNKSSEKNDTNKIVSPKRELTDSDDEGLPGDPVVQPAPVAEEEDEMPKVADIGDDDEIINLEQEPGNYKQKEKPEYRKLSEEEAKSWVLAVFGESSSAQKKKKTISKGKRKPAVKKRKK